MMNYTNHLISNYQRKTKHQLATVQVATSRVGRMEMIVVENYTENKGNLNIRTVRKVWTPPKDVKQLRQ